MKDEKINDLNSKIRNIKQENEIVKSDNDHLTKKSRFYSIILCKKSRRCKKCERILC